MIITDNKHESSLGREVTVIVITTAVSIALQHAAEIIVKKFFNSEEKKQDSEQEQVLTEQDIEQMIDQSVKKHLDLKFADYVAEQKKLRRRTKQQ